jgi:hypothetical protein
VFPVQVTMALLFAALRRADFSMFALALHLPLPRQPNELISPRTLSFAFAVANVFITHGCSGAAVVFTPVCGCFLALQLVLLATGSRKRATGGGGKVSGSNPGGGGGNAGRDRQRRVRRVRKAAVWLTCTSVLLACNLFGGAVYNLPHCLSAPAYDPS